MNSVPLRVLMGVVEELSGLMQHGTSEASIPRTRGFVLSS